MRWSREGLWRHPNFLRLWAGKTISLVGSQITFVAMPLTAYLLLGATPAQMGALFAAGSLPYLIVGLLAGAWVDRLPRRPILIAADIGRALLLASVPLAAALGNLSMGQLYVVTFLAGTLTVFFDVSEEAFLPALVGREQLVEGNSKLAMSTSLAEASGEALAGYLVQWLTAPLAIAVDVASFVASALCLTSIRAVEPPPAPRAERPGLWREIGEGLKVVLRSPALRAMTASMTTLHLFGGMFDGLLALYILQDLRLGPAAVGLLFTAGSLSGLAAALLGERIPQRLGLGRTVVVSAFLIGAGWALLPLAASVPAAPFAVLIAGALVFGAGDTLYNISTASLKQAITPDRLLGRVNASGLFIGGGALPLGALIGGQLGSAIGVQPTLLLAGAGMLLGFVWVVASPLRGEGYAMRET